MKVSLFILLVLSAMFGTCICMDGFFNSSDVDEMDDDFGLEFFSSTVSGLTDDSCFENFMDSPLFEQTLLQIFNEDPSLIVGTDEVADPVTKERPPMIDYWATKWGKMLLDPDIKKPGTKVSKIFQKR